MKCLSRTYYNSQINENPVSIERVLQEACRPKRSSEVSQTETVRSVIRVSLEEEDIMLGTCDRWLNARSASDGHWYDREFNIARLLTHAPTAMAATYTLFMVSGPAAPKSMLVENIFTSSLTSRNGQRRFDDIPMRQMPPPPAPLKGECHTSRRRRYCVVRGGRIAMLWQIVA